jgi:hypothetical protein
MQLRSRTSGSVRHNSSSFSASPDGACSISCSSQVPETAGNAVGADMLHAKPCSSSHVVYLCIPDTAKMAAPAAAAAGSGAHPGSKTPRGSSKQHTPRTPRSFGLGSSKAAAAAASPASGSGIWGWLTPRSSKKKQEAVAAAGAAGSSSGRLAVHTDCISPRYECDIAASPSAGADTLQRKLGPAPVAEGVASGGRHLTGTSNRSAVESLMLQMQSDPTLGSPGPAVPLEALIAAGFGGPADSSASGDLRVLQQGGSLAQRSSWRHAQARAAAKAGRR